MNIGLIAMSGVRACNPELTALGLTLPGFVERNRVIAEGAGACPVACALEGMAGAGKVVCVVSGGNIDITKLCAILTNI